MLDAGTYNVLVGNVVSGVLSEPATLSVVIPVSIVEEPKDVRVVAGGSASFSVKASGDGAYRYEWHRNGVPIAGGTSAVLSLSGLRTQDGGVYDVDVSNVDESGAVIAHAYSRKAQLQVFETPSIVLAPVDQVLQAGGTSSSVGFHVVATGTPPLQYRWTWVSAGTLSGGTLSGGTITLSSKTDSLVILNAGTANLGKYTVSVSGPMGCLLYTSPSPRDS